MASSSFTLHKGESGVVEWVSCSYPLWRSTYYPTHLTPHLDILTSLLPHLIPMYVQSPFIPPLPAKNKFNVNHFLPELSTFLLVITRSSLIMIGDFAFHVIDVKNTTAKKFLALLYSLNLTQHVMHNINSPMHTLDLIITRSNESKIPIYNPHVSGHEAILFDPCPKKRVLSAKMIQYRSLSKIDIAAFISKWNGTNIIFPDLEFQVAELVRLGSFFVATYLGRESCLPRWFNTEVYKNSFHIKTKWY